MIQFCILGSTFELHSILNKKNALGSEKLVSLFFKLVWQEKKSFLFLWLREKINPNTASVLLPLVTKNAFVVSVWVTS